MYLIYTARYTAIFLILSAISAKPLNNQVKKDIKKGSLIECIIYQTSPNCAKQNYSSISLFASVIRLFTRLNNDSIFLRCCALTRINTVLSSCSLRFLSK